MMCSCVVQSGGGREQGAVAAEVAVHSQKKYRVGEVVLVGKIHVYSLSLLPLE